MAPLPQQLASTLRQKPKASAVPPKTARKKKKGNLEAGVGSHRSESPEKSNVNVSVSISPSSPALKKRQSTFVGKVANLPGDSLSNRMTLMTLPETADRSRGKPRPAKIAAVVWRACGSLVTKVHARHAQHTPEHHAWDARLRRLQLDANLLRLAKQVLEWETFAALNLLWMDAEIKFSDDITDTTAENLPGRWELPSGKTVAVCDATAAMIQAFGQGGVKGVISNYMQNYVNALVKRTPIKSYTIADKASLLSSRMDLQREFGLQTSTNKRFQVETRVLANELGKRRVECMKFDTFANSMALKDQFFRVQLRQSQLTSDANLAAKSLYTFRQLSRLYNSVKDFILAELPPNLERSASIASLGSGNSRKSIARRSVRRVSIAAPKAHTKKQQPHERIDMTKGVRMSQMLSPTPTHGPPGSGRKSFIALEHLDEDHELDVQDEEGHMLRIDELQERRDALKMAVARTATKSRFDQLLRLMDQGHEKMIQLAASTRHSEDVIHGVQDALEEEILPQARKWVLEHAKQSKLPREMLDRIQMESLKAVGMAERDALARKVFRLEEMLEENQAESRLERELRAELEGLGGKAPSSPSEKAEAARQRAQRRSRPDLKAQVTRQLTGAFGHTVSDGHDVAPKMSPRASAAGKRRKTRQMERDQVDKGKVLDRIATAMRAALCLRGDFSTMWPKSCSADGDIMLDRIDNFHESTRLVSEQLASLKDEASVDELEDRAGLWSLIAKRLSQTLNSFVDTLEYEAMPEVLVQKALQERKEGKTTRRESKEKSSEGGAVSTKKSKQKQKLQDAVVKLEAQMKAQEEKNASLEAAKLEAQNRLADIQKEIDKLVSMNAASQAVASDASASARPTLSKASADQLAQVGTVAKESSVEPGVHKDNASAAQSRDGAATENAGGSSSGTTIPDKRSATKKRPPSKPVLAAGPLGDAQGELLQARAKRTELQAYVEELEQKVKDLEEGHSLVAIDEKADASQRARLGLGTRKEDDVLIKAANKKDDFLPKAANKKVTSTSKAASPTEDLQGNVHAEVDVARDERDFQPRRSQIVKEDPSDSRRKAVAGQEVIAGQANVGRAQRAKEMGLDTGQRMSDTHEGKVKKSRKTDASNDPELDLLEPWRRIFPNDPPEVARQKYEFCRAHKVVYAHLYIHKKQRRLKFKLLRLVKQQRRHLKLKAKLLMSFLTDDQKNALSADLGLNPDGVAQRQAHHKAELNRLHDRLSMLGKLLAFWRRRMTQFEDEIEGKRKAFRGEVWQALEHVTRMADVLRHEREEERKKALEHAKDEEEYHHQFAHYKRESQHHAPHQPGEMHLGQGHGPAAGHAHHPSNHSIHTGAHHHLHAKVVQQQNVHLKHGHLVDPHYHPPENDTGILLQGSQVSHRRDAAMKDASPTEISGTNLILETSNHRRGSAGKRSAAPEKKKTITDEDKALVYLHNLQGRLKAIHQTCDMSAGEAALSDTLLAPNVKGHALLKHYLGQVVALTEKQFKIVCAQLLAMEQRRLLNLVRDSARRPVRVAIEACNLVIRCLQQQPGKLYQYIHSDMTEPGEADDTKSSSSESSDSSSSFSSTDSEDGKKHTNKKGITDLHKKFRGSDIPLNLKSDADDGDETRPPSKSQAVKKLEIAGWSKLPSPSNGDDMPKSKFARRRTLMNKRSVYGSKASSLLNSGGGSGDDVTTLDVGGKSIRLGSKEDVVGAKGIRHGSKESLPDQTEPASEPEGIDASKSIQKIATRTTVTFDAEDDESPKSPRRMKKARTTVVVEEAPPTRARIFRRVATDMSLNDAMRRQAIADFEHSGDGEGRDTSRRGSAEPAQRRRSVEENSQMALLRQRGMLKDEVDPLLDGDGSKTFSIEAPADRRKSVFAQVFGAQKLENEPGALTRKLQRRTTVAFEQASQESDELNVTKVPSGRESLRDKVKRITARMSSFKSIASNRDDSPSSDGSNSVGSNETTTEQPFQHANSKASLVSTMMAARFCKNLMTSRTTTAATAKTMGHIQNTPAYNEACDKFEKHLKKKGLLNEVQDAAQSMPSIAGSSTRLARAQSAPPKLCKEEDGVKLRQRRRLNKELTAAAFLGRQAYKRRFTLLPKWTDDLNLEWNAIKDAVRQTKRVRLNAQQKRVADMLLEMSGRETPDSMDEESPGTLRRGQYFHQMMADRDREIKEFSEQAEKVRRDIAQNIKKAIQRKTRTDISLDDGRRNWRRKKSTKKFRFSHMDFVDKVKKGQGVSNWQLDQELFAMMEEGGSDHEPEEDVLGFKITPKRKYVSKCPMAHISAKNRKLRHRAVLGFEGDGGRMDVSSLPKARHARFLLTDQVENKAPKWNRWAAKQHDPLQLRASFAIGKSPHKSESKSGHAGKKLNPFRRKPRETADVTVTSAPDTSQQTSDAAQAARSRPASRMIAATSDGFEGALAVQSRRQTAVLQADSLAGLSSMIKAESIRAAELLDGISKIKKRCSVKSDDSSVSSGSEASSEPEEEESDSSSSEIYDPQADDKANGILDPSSMPRRKRRAGYLIPVGSHSLITTAETCLRPALVQEGALLEEKLGVPLPVILQTAIVQDPELQAILLSMPETEFLTAMEGMTVELENRYLQDMDPEQLATLAQIAQRHPPQKRVLVQKQRGQQGQLLAGRPRPQGLLHVGRRTGPPQRVGSKQAPRRAHQRMRQESDFDVSPKSRQRVLIHAAPAEEIPPAPVPCNVGTLDAPKTIHPAHIINLERAMLHRSPEAVPARDFRHIEANSANREQVAKEVMSWMTKDIAHAKNRVRVAKRPHRRNPGAPSAQVQEPRGQQSIIELEDLRGALHEQIGVAFQKHLELWKMWRECGKLPGEQHPRPESQPSDASEVWNDGDAHPEAKIIASDLRGGETQQHSEESKKEPTRPVGVVDQGLEKKTASQAKPFEIGELVMMRNFGDPWREGHVTSLDPLRVNNADWIFVKRDEEPDQLPHEHSSAEQRDARVDNAAQQAPSEEAPSASRHGIEALSVNGARKLPSMVVRPMVVKEKINEPYDISNTKRTGQLPALETQQRLQTPDQGMQKAGGDAPAATSHVRKLNNGRVMNMDTYLQNFDTLDLDVLLHDFSRPGTRLSRPGTRNSRPGTQNSRPATREQYRQDFGEQTAKAPETNVYSSQSTRTPRTLYSATSSATTTSDGWKRMFGARQWPQLPSTAPDARSAGGPLDSMRTPRLPEMGEDPRRINTAAGTSRTLLIHEASQGLASLCSGLEKQAASGLVTDVQVSTPRGRGPHGEPRRLLAAGDSRAPTRSSNGSEDGGMSRQRMQHKAVRG